MRILSVVIEPNSGQSIGSMLIDACKYLMDNGDCPKVEFTHNSTDYVLDRKRLDKTIDLLIATARE